MGYEILFFPNYGLLPIWQRITFVIIFSSTKFKQSNTNTLETIITMWQENSGSNALKYWLLCYAEKWWIAAYFPSVKTNYTVAHWFLWQIHDKIGKHAQSYKMLDMHGITTLKSNTPFFHDCIKNLYNQKKKKKRFLW